MKPFAFAIKNAGRLHSDSRSGDSGTSSFRHHRETLDSRSCPRCRVTDSLDGPAISAGLKSAFKNAANQHAKGVRGGVYRVVRQAMGDTLAKLSVSALLFDYILTGPISAVTAGQYLAGFIEDAALHYLKHPLHFNANYFAATFGILAILYFWWKNIEGIHGR
jgi:hypothetical protein